VNLLGRAPIVADDAQRVKPVLLHVKTRG